MTRLELIENLTGALGKLNSDEHISFPELASAFRDMALAADQLALSGPNVMRAGELVFGKRYRILQLEPGENTPAHKAGDVFTARRGNDWRISTCWVVRSNPTVEDTLGSYVIVLEPVEDTAEISTG